MNFEAQRRLEELPVGLGAYTFLTNNSEVQKLDGEGRKLEKKLVSKGYEYDGLKVQENRLVADRAAVLSTVAELTEPGKMT